MDLIPLTVLVTVPVNIPELRGRHATTPPHGVVTSIRIQQSAIDEIDLATNRINPSMSRSLFIRLAVTSMAQAINAHYDELRRRSEEANSGQSSRDVA